MFLSTVANYLRLGFAITNLNLKTAAQYRFNFFMQIVGHTIMISILYSMWFIFFHQFPSINGWEFSDSALLLGIVAINFSLIELFAEGVENLAETITTGKLDYYLLLPRPVLWMVSVSETLLASIGTFIVGGGMIYFSHAVTITQIPILILVTLLSTIINYNFIVMNNSLAFYFGNMERVVQSLTSTMWDLLFYPQSIFTGFLKVSMMTLLPAFFIGTVPIEVIKNNSMLWLAALISFALIQSCVAYYMFSRGLRRYESGNLFTSKM